MDRIKKKAVLSHKEKVEVCDALCSTFLFPWVELRGHPGRSIAPGRTLLLPPRANTASLLPIVPGHGCAPRARGREPTPFLVCCAQALNKHLSTLSEHYDVPKVSWTK